MSFDSSAKSIFIGDSLTLSLAKGAKEQDVLEYYYLDRPADLIIVSLGTNDGMATSAANPYSQKIRQFISVLKTRYPAASIIRVLPPAMKNTQTENAQVNTRRIISETSTMARYTVFDPRPLTGWARTFSQRNCSAYC